jgi:hypothetical protein
VKLEKKKETGRRLMVLIAWKAYVDRPEVVGLGSSQGGLAYEGGV